MGSPSPSSIVFRSMIMTYDERKCMPEWMMTLVWVMVAAAQIQEECRLGVMMCLYSGGLLPVGTGSNFECLCNGVIFFSPMRCLFFGIFQIVYVRHSCFLSVTCEKLQ